MPFSDFFEREKKRRPADGVIVQMARSIGLEPTTLRIGI